MERNDVFKELKDVVRPDHTALIVWDVQNMLVGRIFNKDEFLSNLNSLIKKAREKNIPIFYTKITPLPERFESGPRLANRWGQMPNDPTAWDLAVKPEKDDIVLNKNTASIFIGTNFELMVRNAGIKTLIFTGIATEIGVESSARDASNRGFYSVIAEDAVSSGDQEAHKSSLANMSRMMLVKKSAEIISSL